MIRGTGSARPGTGVRVVDIETPEQAASALMLALKSGCDAVVHAMAVLDYVPAARRRGKIPSGGKVLNLKMVQTQKIIDMIKKSHPDIFLVGFKLESGASRVALLKNARDLIKRSRADIVVANDLGSAKSNSGHKAYLVEKSGKVIAKATGKDAIAHKILDCISGIAR